MLGAPARIVNNLALNLALAGYLFSFSHRVLRPRV
jgi:hypothetical protein